MEPITYDLFEYMREKKLYYAYTPKMAEQPSTHGLCLTCTAASSCDSHCSRSQKLDVAGAEHLHLYYAAHGHGSRGFCRSVLPNLSTAGCEGMRPLSAESCSGLHPPLTSKSLLLRRVGYRHVGLHETCALNVQTYSVRA